MSPELMMFVILSLGAGSALVALVAASVIGRQPIVHRWVWVIGLIVAGLPAVFITIVSVAVFLSPGGVNWIIVGGIGLWAIFVTAIIRPRIAAWVSIASGVALPLLLLLAQWVSTEVNAPIISPLTGLGSYSWRAVLLGGLLLWSVHERAKAEAPAPTESVSSAA